MNLFKLIALILNIPLAGLLSDAIFDNMKDDSVSNADKARLALLIIMQFVVVLYFIMYPVTRTDVNLILLTYLLNIIMIPAIKSWEENASDKGTVQALQWTYIIVTMLIAIAYVMYKNNAKGGLSSVLEEVKGSAKKRAQGAGYDFWNDGDGDGDGNASVASSSVTEPQPSSRPRSNGRAEASSNEGFSWSGIRRKV